MENQFWLPFLLTLFAGLSTGIGSLIAFLAKKTNKNFLSFALGLSAGVMIYISFVEMLIESQHSLSSIFGDKLGLTYSTLCFFAGMLIVALIDKLVPSYENPHEIRGVEDMNKKADKSLKRMGIMAAIAISIHNFPEGIATFISAIENPRLGLVIAAAIAIHNIPEGIAISVPIYHSTGSKKKAFLLSALSGLAEPLGATIAYLVLMPFISPALLGYIFAIVAGIMVFISFDELLPAAHEYGKHHLPIYGLVLGMGIMALSLIIL